ncbi:hypothetical protein NDU88_002787 [Pleurodeles waltl]|uniref:Uncharacterized protein n=1 Tax=Pleurodeles waltl TaxID=8319 RepID=A0AAV7KWM9_PLEWA|nr:hypothetical protein NDU88_002787 [Pleurodeles waltl]
MVKSAELTGRCAKAVLRSEEKSFSKLEDNATIAMVKKNNELSSKRVHSGKMCCDARAQCVFTLGSSIARQREFEGTLKREAVYVKDALRMSCYRGRINVTNNSLSIS